MQSKWLYPHAPRESTNRNREHWMRKYFVDTNTPVTENNNNLDSLATSKRKLHFVPLSVDHLLGAAALFSTSSIFEEEAFDTQHLALLRRNCWLFRLTENNEERWCLKEFLGYQQGDVAVYRESTNEKEIVNSLKQWIWLAPETKEEDTLGPLYYCHFRQARFVTVRISTPPSSHLRAHVDCIQIDTDDYYLVGTIEASGTITEADLDPILQAVSPCIAPVQSKIVEFFCKKKPTIYKDLVQQGVLPGSWGSTQEGHFHFDVISQRVLQDVGESRRKAMEMSEETAAKETTAFHSYLHSISS